MEQSNSSEEIDLNSVIRKIKESYHGFLISLFRGFQYLVRNWILILILAVAGIVLGYFLDKNKGQSRETTLLVQINFDAVNYVYDAVDQFNRKTQENDTVFLKEEGFLKNDKIIITKIEIEPIVNIMDILKNTTGNDGYIQAVFEQSKFEDDILTSEIFIPEYKYHRINLEISEVESENVVGIVLGYINKNEILNKIKEITVENTKQIIEKNKESISYIDSIVKVYGTLIESKTQSSQFYYNSYEVNNGNIHLMFQQKSDLLGNNERLQVELAKYDNIVELLNKPKLQFKKGFFNKNIIFLPVVFIMIFLLSALVLRLFSKAKRLSKLAE